MLLPDFFQLSLALVGPVHSVYTVHRYFGVFLAYISQHIFRPVPLLRCLVKLLISDGRSESESNQKCCYEFFA